MTKKILLAIPLLFLAAACSVPADDSQIVTFTDEHGRVCTAVIVIDQDDNRKAGREAQALDCDYPPEGRSPGASTYKPLPGGPLNKE